MDQPVKSIMDRVIVETGISPTHAVIWLHGLGADGHDFEPIVPQLKSAAERSVRFVFPHAPVRPVTVNAGMAMRAWYDILGINIDRDQDREGIYQSLALIDQLIDEQQDEGIDSKNILLAGFSQGGAMALRCGLARRKPLGGVIALSCYLLESATLAEWQSPAGRQIPLFIGHGDQDPIVPVALGSAAARQLEAAGYPVHWQSWPMAHSVCMDEVAAIDAWMSERWA